MMSPFALRGFGCAIAWIVAVSGAAAQTEVVPKSAAQRLTCLVKPDKPLAFPEQNKLDRAYGSIRLLLKFIQPDAKPAVEVLFNSAREDMQDLVFKRVAQYRLPCLQPQDGEVTAVQEFSFRNHDRDPEPVLTDDGSAERPPSCVVMPRRALSYTFEKDRMQAEHLVADITFSGPGDAPPEVRFAYAKASGALQRAVRDWVSEYRTPCRTAADKPLTIRQHFSMFPDNKRRFGFDRERFPLMDFLAMTQEPLALRAYFDLKTMGCPFRVSYVIGNAEWPHEVSAHGPVDPNRLAFLGWLRALNIRFSSEEMANDLFGTTLQIDVPCGLLNLQG